jgi:hypothetical protein
MFFKNKDIFPIFLFLTLTGSKISTLKIFEFTKKIGGTDNVKIRLLQLTKSARHFIHMAP